MSKYGFRPWERHSLILIVGGILYISVGISIALPNDDITQEATAYRYALSLLSESQWGTLFILVGICALLSSIWPQASRTWGYIMLAVLSAAWAFLNIFGMIFANGPLFALTNSLVWIMMTFLWWAVSGMLSPRKNMLMIIGRDRR